MTDLLVLALVLAVGSLWLLGVGLLAYGALRLWRQRTRTGTVFLFPWWVCFPTVALTTIAFVLPLAIVMGAISGGSGPLAPGCYYADVESSTSSTFVQSGQVMVPITTTSRYNVFYSIACPAGVGR